MDVNVVSYDVTQIVGVLRPAILFLAGVICGLATVVGVTRWM